MRKGRLFSFVTLVFALGLFGCSKSDTGSNNSSSGTVAGTQLNWDQGNWNQSNWQ